MAAENVRNEDTAVCRNLGVAVLAAIGLAVLLTMAPSSDDGTAPVTATHGPVADAGQ